MLRRGASEQPTTVDGLASLSSVERSGKAEPAALVRRSDDHELMLGQWGQPIELGAGQSAYLQHLMSIWGVPVRLKVISERCLGDE
jgi:spore cortex formation protein SpoVR/YcgB (stage V sporulation)